MTGVLDYLEKSAELYPDKIAFSCEDEKYTFSEVELYSKQLASCVDINYKNKAIIVFCNRNAHIPIFFFATVYSGNFYVPIDPEMPAEKVRAIINDCCPSYVFGDKEAIQILDKIGFRGDFFSLSDKKNNITSFSEQKADRPIYMIYTSGSTGKPKGVLKSDRAVVSFIESYNDTFVFSENDVIGNQTPFFFDASAKDLYLCIKTGATTEIIPSSKFAMPTTLIEYMNERKITFISWVPTALSIVSQFRTFSYVKPEYLQKVFFVGEVMPMKHLNYWRENLPDIQYVNLYGQSEIAGICCYYDVQGEFDSTAVLPMGKALKNCKLYLSDNGKIVTEPGHIGEMYIVSDALALCYYNDKEKTEASFLYKDFGSGMELCFKTGDLASFDAEGNFVFASRNDFQIKHMGHRIELGEIEAVAGSLEQINRCCALYNAEKQSIVLFVETNTQTTPRELKHELRQKLVTYMMPEKVKILEELPINANGKINRTKLKELL